MKRFVNRKTILPILVIIGLLIIIKNIVGSILSLEENRRILTDLKTEQNEAKSRNQFLKERLYYVQTNEFVEREAREKLGMVKDGEQIVIVPPVSSVEQKKQNKDELPNWEKWKRLFF